LLESELENSNYLTGRKLILKKSLLKEKASEDEYFLRKISQKDLFRCEYNVNKYKD